MGCFVRSPFAQTLFLEELSGDRRSWDTPVGFRGGKDKGFTIPRNHPAGDDAMRFSCQMRLMLDPWA